MSDPFTPVPDENDDPIARRLRRALAEEADMVRPSDNAYDELTERIAREHRPRPWLPWAAGLAAAVVAGAVFGAVVVGGGGDDDPQPVAAPSASETVSQSEPAPSPSPSSDATSEPAPSTGAPTGTIDGVPVYWVGASATSSWLYREFRDVPDTGSVVGSAVTAMTREDPLDPDYSSPWSPASRVEVEQTGDRLAVDLSEDAFASTDVGSELAELAVQQLVYTATAAADVAGEPASTVTVTVDGQPYDAWGAIRLGEPMQRAPQVDVQASTWILTPQEGATVDAGTVEFTGYGTAFEGTFQWEVRDAAGDVVADGFTNGGSMGTFDEFGFTADLEPGRYTVEVFQEDMSDGESPEGPRMYPDTKEFTVE